MMEPHCQLLQHHFFCWDYVSQDRCRKEDWVVGVLFSTDQVDETVHTKKYLNFYFLHAFCLRLESHFKLIFIINEHIYVY